MPMISVPLYDASQPTLGLSLMGEKHTVSPNALRRARGIHHSNIGHLRSRVGSRLLYSITDVRSFTRFNDSRFFNAGGILYRNGTALSQTFNGNPLLFTRMPPADGVVDYLFISNGGSLVKIAPTTYAITPWGIDAPTTTLTVTANAAHLRSIDTLESAASWTAANCTLSDESAIKIQGTNSLRMNANESVNATATKSITIDLSTFSGGTVSPNEDWIELWVRADSPESIDHLEIAFSLGNTTFTNNFLSRSVYVSGKIEPYLQPSNVQRFGVGDFGDTFFNQDRVVAGNLLATPDEKANLIESINRTTIPPIRNTWTQLRLPKSTFIFSGDATVLNWSNVQAVRLTCKTRPNGAVNLYWDDLQLHGAFGRQGDYDYQYTWRNTVTGNRSNPSPKVSYSNATRESVQVSGYVASTDPQVDQRETWRTMGNGTFLFRVQTTTNGSANFNDTVADFDGLDSSGANPLMENLALPVDNDPPFDTFIDCLFDPDGVFWLDGAEGRKGRVYYSPANRHECFKGFIDVTDDDDPLQRLVRYNGIRYAISTSRVFRIEGSLVFSSRLVSNIPGVLPAQRLTVADVANGLLWQSKDGFRLFNGSSSQLIADNRIGALARNESLENIPAFFGICATSAREEYLISDGSITLAINLTTGQIRDLGIGCTALYYEEDTDTILAGTSTGVYALEDTTLSTDAGHPLTFEVETRAESLLDKHGAYASRLYIRAVTTNSQPVTPVLIMSNNTTLSLPPFTTDTERLFEYPIGRITNFLGVRLQASLLLPITIADIWLDVYMPVRKLSKPLDQLKEASTHA